MTYTVSLLRSPDLGAVSFDTTVAGSGTWASKQLFDPNSVTPFLTLTSIDGSKDPAAGYHYFTPRSVFNVTTYNMSSTGMLGLVWGRRKADGGFCRRA